MDQFIQLENFPKIAPYAELFWQGTLVTVLLALFTVVIGFCLALILALMRMSNINVEYLTMPVKYSAEGGRRARLRRF